MSVVASKMQSVFGSWHRRPWHWRKVERASLARYVNAACAADVVADHDDDTGSDDTDSDSARDLDQERTAHDSIHLDGNPLVVAEELFELVAQRDIEYDIDGYVADTEAVQRIRTPIEIWNRRRATCLDLALFYAGLCLDKGLRPLVVVVDGHALVALFTAQFPMPLPEPSDDADQLLGWIENGTVVPIECTMMALGQDLDGSFDQARAAGQQAIESRSLRFFFDPAELQKAGRVEPEPCRAVSPTRVGASVLALLLLTGGGIWWLARPQAPAMQATGGANLAVFPFSQQGALDQDAGVAVANELVLAVREAFNEQGQLQSADRRGWEVWGPEQLEADARDALELDANLGPELAARNIDVAVYGLIEEVNDRTFVDVNVWFEPSDRSTLGGVTGPITVRRDTRGSNGSVAQVAEQLAGDIDSWIAVVGGLGVLQDATSVDGLYAARDKFVAASQAGAGSSDGGHLEALSQLMIGGTHLLIDATIPVDESRARNLNLDLATKAYDRTIEVAGAGPADGSNDELAVRANLGLAQVRLARSGCKPDGHIPAELGQARLDIDAARSAFSTDVRRSDPAELLLKTLVTDGRVEWCHWASEISDGSQAMTLLTDAIDNFEARTDERERERAEHLAATAYALRALLQGDPGGGHENPEASLADALRAECLSPDLSGDFVRDGIHEDLASRYPDLERKSCRGV